VSLCVAVLWVGAAPAVRGIYKATLEEQGQRTREISTDELRRVLRDGLARDGSRKDGAAVVLDARPPREYAIGHIPGAKNAPGGASLERSRYIPDPAEVLKLLGEDRKAPVVIYCNGPYSDTSRRLADELVAAGYRNVRRYQLGIPVWRALGEVCAVEFEGFRSVVERDRTAVVIDAREEESFRTGSLPGSKNLPKSAVERDASSEIRHAIDDGRLPMEDRNLRIFVLGEDGPSARLVAEAIAREAFHNVSFFDGGFAKASATSGP
jgi:rhodanese-related sulfurtransferase